MAKREISLDVLVALAFGAVTFLSLFALSAVALGADINAVQLALIVVNLLVTTVFAGLNALHLKRSSAEHVASELIAAAKPVLAIGEITFIAEDGPVAPADLARHEGQTIRVRFRVLNRGHLATGVERVVLKDGTGASWPIDVRRDAEVEPPVPASGARWYDGTVQVPQAPLSLAVRPVVGDEVQVTL